MYNCLNLNEYFNNKGITSIHDREKGDLDPFVGLSLPSSHLTSEFTFKIGDDNIPLSFDLNSDVDNMELTGQEIFIEEKFYSDIYIVGTCNNGNYYNDILIYCSDGTTLKKRIYLSDIFEENASNDEICLISFPYTHTKTGVEEHLKPKLWLYHIKLENHLYIKGMKFSENPFIHIFSITLKEGDNIAK
jgi:hypothetical protein